MRCIFTVTAVTVTANIVLKNASKFSNRVFGHDSAVLELNRMSLFLLH